MKRRRLTAAECPNNLRLYRTKAGMNLQDVAAELGISYQTVGKFETGERRIKLDQMEALSGIFGRPIADLFPEVLSPNQQALLDGFAEMSASEQAIVLRFINSIGTERQAESEAEADAETAHRESA